MALETPTISPGPPLYIYEKRRELRGCLGGATIRPTDRVDVVLWLEAVVVDAGCGGALVCYTDDDGVIFNDDVVVYVLRGEN